MSLATNYQFLTQDAYFLPILQRLKARVNVLLAGPPGSGRDFFARHIHKISSGGASKFIKLSFRQLKKPQDVNYFFSLPPSGTENLIYLDNIEGLSNDIQNRIAHLIMDRSLTPESSTPRFIASLTCDVTKDMVSSPLTFETLLKSFITKDLLAAFQKHRIGLIPLRERLKDLPILIEHFLSMAERDEGITCDKEAMDVLQHYNWPGNIKELKVMCEAMAAIAYHRQKGLITRETAQNLLVSSTHAAVAIRLEAALHALSSEELIRELGLKEFSHLCESVLIARAIQQSGKNLSLAAQDLRLPISTLSSKLKVLRRHLDVVNTWFS